MHKIHVVSLGIYEDDIGPRARELIRSARFIAGGARHLDRLAPVTACRIPLARDMDQAIERIRDCLKTDDVVVLASGDALFFGIGQKLLENFDANHLIFHSNITTVQAAFARLGMPWNDVMTVSLHGRAFSGLRYALLRSENRPIAVFTDSVNSPAKLALWLEENGLEDTTVFILEELGGPNERIRRMSVREMQGQEFSPLNLVIIDARPSKPMLFPGMPEEAYAHNSGLITKREVRTIAVSRLMPLHDQIFWDIGAGSGSIGLEASLFLPKGMVFCVEKDAQRCLMIEENRKKYGRLNVKTIQGNAPECLADLPDPHRIFIGGGGERLQDILDICWQRLEIHGKLVVSVILLQNICIAQEFFQDKNPEAIHIQISRSRALASSAYAKAENPVWLFVAEKAGHS
ncbi:MAG: precorrin-6y C5,15-methyltransferase (decarboxylating) subunit CbiE [Deltaproteobacteria bacterium]|nr:precorrin-6y C5,15-methyltransferase (decarboxylating) subunit CbiE [Deltaproteobacteria bacterium]